MMSTPERSEEQTRKWRRSSAPECAAFAAFRKFELREDVPLRLGRWSGRSVDGLALVRKAESAGRRSAGTRPRMQTGGPHHKPRVPILMPGCPRKMLMTDA